MAVKITTIKLGADTKSFKREMKRSKKYVSSFGKQVKQVAGMLAGAFAARQLVSFSSSAVKAYDVQAKAEAELLTALKGRKNAQQELIAQAQRLQKITLFGDEDTIHAEALIGAFVKEKDQIKQIIPLVQDFATAKRMDLAAASDLVSKTLGSSTNALTRYGISVTGAVGSNERLASVVRGLSDAFKGQAETAAKAGAGGLKQLANVWGDVKEAIGGAIYHGIEPMVSALKEILTPAQSVTEEFNSQATKVENLKKNISPLLDKYDALKKKTNLSAIEQKQLNGLIDQIGKALPTAITQFNKYGTAIDISTTAGRHAIKVQERMMELANSDAIKKQQEKLNKLNYDIATVSFQLKKGTKTITINRGNLPSITKEVKLLAGEITTYQAKLNNLQLSKEAVQKSINLLKGIQDGTIQLNQAQRNQIDNYNHLFHASLDYSKALTKEQQKQLENAQASKKVIINLEKMEEHVKSLQAKRDKLAAEALVNPSAIPQSAVDEINALDKKINTLTKKIQHLKSLTPKTPSVDYEIKQTPIDEKKVSVNDIDLSGLSKLEEERDKAAAGLTNFKGIAINVAGAVNGAMQNMVMGITNAFSGLVDGSLSVKMFFNSILLAIADFMKQIGSALISMAVAAIAMKSLFANPWVALAAGIALIAAGSVMSLLIKKGPKTPGMAEGGVVPAGFANDGYPARLTSGEVVIPPKKLDVFFGEMMKKINPPNLAANMSQSMPRNNIKFRTIPIEIKINGSFRQNGSDLLAVIDKSTVIRQRIRGF